MGDRETNRLGDCVTGQLLSDNYTCIADLFYTGLNTFFVSLYVYN